MLDEICQTGVDAVELGYRLTDADVKTIVPALKGSGLKAVSLHNFCPLPFDEISSRHPSNHYRLSALDEAERRKAVHWTKNTIDTAVQAGAQVVVVHAGTVELQGDSTRKILDLYRAGQDQTPEFSQLRARLLELRRQNAGAYLQNVERSFKEILPYAQDKNIKLGLETRYYPFEIPNHEEIGYLLDRFHKEGLSYWHDVGHAEVNSRLGITPHEDYLKDYGERLIGWHLHGVNVLRDHLAPFDGDFDLTSVFPFIKDDHIKVIESHTSAHLEQIRKAVEQLSEAVRR